MFTGTAPKLLFTSSDVLPRCNSLLFEFMAWYDTLSTCFLTACMMNACRGEYRDARVNELDRIGVFVLFQRVLLLLGLVVDESRLHAWKDCKLQAYSLLLRGFAWSEPIVGNVEACSNGWLGLLAKRLDLVNSTVVKGFEMTE